LRHKLQKSPRIDPTGGAWSGGTATSSITWVKNVALARISRSSILEVDCGTIASIAALRCIRQGEKMSRTGTANTTRQGSADHHLWTRPRIGRGRLPITWSRASIALSIGSRCAGVQSSWAEVTRMIGCVPSSKPCSNALVQPISWLDTTKASAGRCRFLRSVSSPSPTWSGVAGVLGREPSSFGPGSITITRTPPLGIGSRRAAASSG